MWQLAGCPDNNNEAVSDKKDRDSFKLGHDRAKEHFFLFFHFYICFGFFFSFSNLPAAARSGSQ